LPPIEINAMPSWQSTARLDRARYDRAESFPLSPIACSSGAMGKCYVRLVIVTFVAPCRCTQTFFLPDGARGRISKLTSFGG
jgi:hypothetical protein